MIEYRWRYKKNNWYIHRKKGGEQPRMVVLYGIIVMTMVTICLLNPCDSFTLRPVVNSPMNQLPTLHDSNSHYTNPSLLLLSSSSLSTRSKPSIVSRNCHGIVHNNPLMMMMVPPIISEEILSASVSILDMDLFTTVSNAVLSFSSSILPSSGSSTNLISTTATEMIEVSPEPIHTLFSVATFGPQIFWLFMILLPSNKITKFFMSGLEIPIIFALVHFGIVVASLGAENGTAGLAEFNNVFDPNGDPQRAFMVMTSQYPNFVAEEWSHVLTWDLFIGRYIWIDGLKRNIFTSHSVLLSNLIGPPGLLLHWLTCRIFYNKPLIEQDEKDEIMEL